MIVFLAGATIETDTSKTGASLVFVEELATLLLLSSLDEALDEETSFEEQAAKPNKAATLNKVKQIGFFVIIPLINYLLTP